jgi:uncharacterized protein HemY
MATYSLGAEHARLANRLLAVLQEEPDAVKQQIAIELLTVSHAMRMGDPATAVTIANSVHKHVLQLAEQSFRFMASRG